MATSADSSGIGKDPSSVDDEQPDDDQFEQFLDTQTEESDDPGGDDLPSKRELWQVIQKQQDQIEAMSNRIEDLEATVEEVEFEADTIEEVAADFREGKIGGPAGSNFLRGFLDVPSSDNLLNARSKKLFFRIIEEYQVGKPVTSSQVVEWLDLDDSSNPSVQAKRVMERLERHREDGYLIGSIRTGKHRGKNAIWLER